MGGRAGITFRRTGFTLVELLVVIAIIGMLVALLLPAVQAAREAARRAKCQSNLKNIALALQNYHSARNRFPKGFVAQPETVEAWAWSVYILPYLEEQAIYDRCGEDIRDLVHHSDRGVQYLAMRYTERLANCGHRAVRRELR